MATVEERNARLGAMLKLLGGHPVLSPDEALRYVQLHLTGADVIYLEDVDADDLALLNACVEIEHELRGRASDTLSRLLPLVSGGRARSPSV